MRQDAPPFDPSEDLLHATLLRRLKPARLAEVLRAQDLPLCVEGAGEVDATTLDLGRLQLLSLRFRSHPVRLTVEPSTASALLLRAPANGMALSAQKIAPQSFTGGDIAMISPRATTTVLLETGGRLDVVLLKGPGPRAEAPLAVLPLSLASVKMLIYFGGYLLRAAPHRRSDAQMLQRQFIETLQMAMDHLSRDWAFPTEIERLSFSMEAALGDRDLTLTSFARQVGMSSRKVQAVFAASGLTFSDVLRDKRLDRARRALCDGGADLKVAQVGFDSGFKDASYFSKCFRARFGISPTACRRAALAQANPAEDAKSRNGEA
ncbi:helix-turn-helix domain-containing protein [Pseudooceanicola marinus]|uniref:helix-turn-helix domain-containing protein n=1 Tax=Pseudooceanicola marinus TaxID=396013 RepID=UPI001CD3099B|nr:helix-turn-helix transcriptional regulator [Pseudooceanicola marinus]MCA1334552.1 helix-turn-helix transcriptional regulator [Pseudooceanicola marinus]